MDRINYKAIFIGFILGIFGSFIVPISLEYIKNAIFLVPVMEDNLLIEIKHNKIGLRGMTADVQTILNDIENKIPNIAFGKSGDGFDDVYKQYFYQLNFLSKDIRSKIIVYYLNLKIVDISANTVVWNFDRYNQTPRLASEANLEKSLARLSQAAGTTLGLGDDIIKEFETNPLWWPRILIWWLLILI